MTYKNIPVDPETAKKIEALCVAYEMGRRGQGALVRKLVKAEYEKLAAVRMLPGDAPKIEPQAQA